MSRKSRQAAALIDDATKPFLETDAVPAELKRAAQRAKRQQQNIAEKRGFGETAPARAIARKWLPALMAGIERALAVRTRSPLLPEFLAVIRGLDVEVLALCVFQTALDSVVHNNKLRDAEFSIGTAISGECWSRGLTNYAPQLAKRIEKYARRKHKTSTKRRQQVARAQAARAGYRSKDWDRERCVQAGNWAIDQLLTVLPDVFITTTENEQGGPERLLVLTEAAQAFARDYIAELIRCNPVWLPVPDEPPRWTDWAIGGTSDKRLSLSLRVMRAHGKRTGAAVRAAIRSKDMQPALDALNALQGTAWAINSRVLEVLRACIDKHVEVPSLPPMTDLEMPEPEISWKAMDADARRSWLSEATLVEEHNRKRRGQRTLLWQDIETATVLAQHERFWTPMNLDWRGRVYGVPHFNFQRDDRVRALFLFANDEPIGEEGLKWLKVHTANCGDFDKISKRSFDERLRWVDENRKKIEDTAAEPLKDLWWTEADNPFQFLAACFELSSALARGPKFVSRLPVCFDGSCNGLQHLAAMTRDQDTAALVNLTASTAPRDIYQQVAEDVERRVECDLNSADQKKRSLAKICLDNRIDRKLLKRNVMTFSYGSKVKGMAEQLYEDTMLPKSLSDKGNPWGNDGGDKASWYLAQYAHEAIKNAVGLPAEAMRFLQRLVRAANKEKKALSWRSPAGVPWINSYNTPDTKQVHLWMHDGGVRVRYTTKLAVGELPKIDEDAAVNGVSPNFVHACDAAHLMRTVNAAVAEGITSIATVHDGFGCLPSRAERFRKIIREEFVRMYEEHDVLAEVLEWARKDLKGENSSVRLADKRPAAKVSLSTLRS